MRERRNPSGRTADRNRPDPGWKLNETVRRRRLREQGQRPLAENLAEGLALSEFLSGFTGAARR